MAMDNEHENIFAIPANYTDSGKILGGFLEPRNAMETGIDNSSARHIENHCNGGYADPARNTVGSGHQRRFAFSICRTCNPFFYKQTKTPFTKGGIQI